MDCPRCNKKIRADDANLDLLVAKCANCQNMFGFEQVLANVEGKVPLQPSPTFTRPARFCIEESNDLGRHVICRWIQPESALIIVMAIGWNVVAWLLTI